MDRKTYRYYQTHALDLVAQYGNLDQTSVQRLVALLPLGSRVLDVGCGTGRDLAWLLEQKLDARGIDASEAMIDAARNHYGIAPERMWCDTLPELSTLTGIHASFEGVHCRAVLQHIPDSLLRKALRRLVAVVASGGILALDVPEKRAGIVQHRDVGGRYFRLREPEMYRRGLTGMGMVAAETHRRQSPTFQGVWEVQLYRAP